MGPDARVFVAGHRGLVGSAIVRELGRRGYSSVLTQTRSELDLTDARAVEAWFAEVRPEFVILAAAKVGGILANQEQPAEFLRENLLIQGVVIEAARKAGVERLLFLGSSCIYPKVCPQPIREEYLLTGELEPTNRPYALAKIAGVEMCWSYNRQYGTRYLAAMPTNLYGAENHFDIETSHVLPALLRKAHRAKLAGAEAMEVWGSGTPRREFLYSDDMARACVHLMELPEVEFNGLLGQDRAPLVNIGYGSDLTIRELAELVCRVVGFEGELRFDASKPDGTMRKLMDSSRMLGLGWRPEVGLEEGIARVYEAVAGRL